MNMKQQLPLILCVICCLLAIGSTMAAMARISSLEQQISQLNQKMENQYLDLSNRIVSNVSQVVENKLEEGANLLSASTYTYDNVNYQKGTVDVVCSISPREFSPQETTATITVNDKEYPMNLKNTEFLCRVPLSLFEETQVSSVTFRKGDSIQKQALNWSLTPRGQFLPRMYSRFSGSSWGKAEDVSTYAWHKEGQLKVDVEQKGGLSCEIADLDLVQLVDGEEVDRFSLLGKVYDANTIVWGKQDKATITSEDPFALIYEMDQAFLAPFGSTVEIVVEMQDSNGFIYRNWLDSVEITSDGKYADNTLSIGWSSLDGNIYDSDGKLLFGQNRTPLGS